MMAVAKPEKSQALQEHTPEHTAPVKEALSEKYIQEITSDISGAAYEVVEPVGQLCANAVTYLKHKVRPQWGDRVDITYHAFKHDCMTPIEVNIKHSFVVGEDHTIDAFDLGVRKMTVGDRAILKTPPHYAFGAFGRPPLYPPNQKCTFSVTLETCASFDYTDPLKFNVRMNYVQSLWERGNFLFYAMKEYSRAASVYANGVLYLHDHKRPSAITQKMLKQIHTMHKKLYAPLMHCYFQTENYRRSMQAADRLMEVDPLNIKALFMKGRCLALTGNKNLGLQVLTQAHQLKQNDMEIKTALDALQNELLAERDAKARSAKKNGKKGKGKARSEKKGKGSVNSILAQKAFSNTIQTEYSTANQAMGSKIKNEEIEKEPLLIHIIKPKEEAPVNSKATIIEKVQKNAESSTEIVIEKSLDVEATGPVEKMDEKDEVRAGMHRKDLTGPLEQEDEEIDDVELKEEDIETQVNDPAIVIVDILKEEMDVDPSIKDVIIAPVEHDVDEKIEDIENVEKLVFEKQLVANPVEDIQIQVTDAAIVENQKDDVKDRVSTSCCPGLRKIAKRSRKFFGCVRRRRYIVNYSHTPT